MAVHTARVMTEILGRRHGPAQYGPEFTLSKVTFLPESWRGI